MKKKIIVLSLIAGLSLQGCESLVEVEPQASLSSGTALSTLGGYQAVLTSAYDRIQSFNYWGRDMALMGDALSDNIFTVTSQAAGRYTGANRNARGSHFNIWGTGYATINDLNTILASIDAFEVPASDAAAKQRVKAEALALRAMVYFDLARVYGYEPNSVPTTGTNAGNNKSVVLRLTPTTTPAEADLRIRSTATEVYTQIETDLKAAIPLLTNGGAPFRMNLGAAHALLGKVYLYWEKFPEAEASLKLALANTTATLATNYTAAFSGTPEALLAVNFVQATEVAGVTGVNDSPFSYTQPNGRNTPYSGAANVSTYGGQTPSNELLALFGLTPTLTNQATVTDQRTNLFYRSASTTSGGVMYTWARKYNAANGSYTDNIQIIRYADVMLMLAEAQVRQATPKITEAVALLTQLRTARNADATVVIPTSADALFQFIKEERRRELYYEGHRWFDLKRWEQGITKPALTALSTIPHSDYNILAPLPNAEVQLNPALPQNPGY